MTYEDGYHWLLGNVDSFFDNLVALMIIIHWRKEENV